MAAKHMKIRKVILSIITIAILTSQLAGCAVVKSDELMKMIDEGDTVVIELSVPADEKVDANTVEIGETTPLDQLTTYSENGFRSEFDKLFNINTVTSGDKNTKQGCIYTVKKASAEVQKGDVSFHTAYQNRVFVNTLKSEDTANKLSKLVEKVYTDVDATDKSATNACLNAYFDLIREENNNDSTYGGSRALTRNQFINALYNSTHDTVSKDEIEKMGWLQEADGSLNDKNKDTAITKAEAVYYITKLCFKNEVAQVNAGENEPVGKYRNAGDLATTIGAKESTASKAWENNVLAYMVKNPSKGMQQELFNAVKVASKYKVIDANSIDLYAPVTKDEFISLIRSAYDAENTAYGYKTIFANGVLNKNINNSSADNNPQAILDDNSSAGTNSNGSSSNTSGKTSGTSGKSSGGSKASGKTSGGSTGSGSTGNQSSGTAVDPASIPGKSGTSADINFAPDDGTTGVDKSQYEKWTDPDSIHWNG